MLPEMVRLFYQHRAFYGLHCYVILSVWIFLLIAGVYKYTGVDYTNVQSKGASSEFLIGVFPRNLKSDGKTKKIFRFCNGLNDISLGNEGRLEENVTLEGILVLIRHGDRGPLSHVRNISSINCGGDFSENPELENVYQKYQNFLQSTALYSRTAWAQFLGPFHGFPMLPANAKDCKLAQLTTLGIGQLLKTGLLLRRAYYNKLNLANSTLMGKDILVYSTRYRRTVQSAVALLYAFLESDGFQSIAKISFKESQSYTFCNNDCACPVADKFRNLHSKETSRYLKSHPAVVNLIKQAATVIFEMPDHVQSSAGILQDALLTYVCHNAPLPCVELETPQNIPYQRLCVKNDQVTGFFAYMNWEVRQFEKSKSRKKHGMLKAYGLLKNIVSHMLKIVSENKPKVVLFSGHDKTLEYLAVALGIYSDHAPNALFYASRFIFEVYKVNLQNDNHLASDFYFRILVNGRDLTSQVPFCKTSSLHTVHYFEVREDNERVKVEAKLCSIETIIRLLHDDYFAPFNATNFKDACFASREKH